MALAPVTYRSELPPGFDPNDPSAHRDRFVCRAGHASMRVLDAAPGEVKAVNEVRCRGELR